MNEVMREVKQTPIEIALQVDEEGRTTARKLYDFLQLADGQFSRWAKKNIIKNKYAVEGEDYWGFDMDVEGNIVKDYTISSQFAKKLCMQSNSPRGEEARDYFILVEDKLKEATAKRVDRSKLPAGFQAMYEIMDNLSAVKLEQLRQQEELKKQTVVVNEHTEKIDNIIGMFAPTDTTDFQNWARTNVRKVANSPKFTNGRSENERYRNATIESYARLNSKRPCRLDVRLRNAQEVALRNGATQSRVNAISKLQVICEDKDLRLAYKEVVQEMKLFYNVA